MGKFTWRIGRFFFWRTYRSINWFNDWILNHVDFLCKYHLQVDNVSFSIANEWLMMYESGDYAKYHDHFPFCLSVIYYVDCDENAEVWLYEVVGGGHDWPGSSGNMDIQASEQIWSFFSQYTYILGDINNDGSVDILDAIEEVSLVLNDEYNQMKLKTLNYYENNYFLPWIPFF